jgi:hypothetical protein
LSDRYRIDLRIRGDRLLVNLEGPHGPDAERHLNEVRAAAARCDLDVVVHRRATGPRRFVTRNEPS